MIYTLLEYNSIFVIYWLRCINMHKKKFATIITVKHRATGTCSYKRAWRSTWQDWRAKPSTAIHSIN
jgi:hypothetical protein